MEAVGQGGCCGRVNHYLDRVPTAVKITAIVLGLLALTAVVTLYKTNQISLQVAGYAGAASGLVLIVGLLALNSIRNLCCRTQQNRPKKSQRGTSPIPARPVPSILPEEAINGLIRSRRLEEAFEMVRTSCFETGAIKDGLLSQIVIKHVELSQLDKAFNIAKEIRPGAQKSYAYFLIVEGCIDQGAHSQALGLIADMDPNLYGYAHAHIDPKFAEFASILLRENSLRDAETVIGKISGRDLRNHSYERLASRYLKMDDLQNAETVIEKIQGSYRGDLLYAKLADKYLEMDDFQNAKTMIGKMNRESASLDPFYAKFARFFIEQNLPESAISCAQKIMNEDVKESIFPDICGLCLQNDEVLKAKGCIQFLSLKDSKSQELCGKICVELAKIDQEEEIQHIFVLILFEEFKSSNDSQRPPLGRVSLITAKANQLANELTPQLASGSLDGPNVITQVKAAFLDIATPTEK